MSIPAFPDYMSLRDYFAAEAMSGFIAAMPHMGDLTDKRGGRLTEETIARQAYDFADAMVEARKS